LAETFNILVTGGGGYLGAILVPELLAAGHAVTVLDSFLYRACETSLASCCADRRFDIARGDARNVDTLRPLVKRADIVVPLAALVGAPLCNADQVGARTVNVGAVKTLISLLSREQRLLMPITNSGYGVGEPGKYCTEETPMRPVSLYGVTKVEAEKAMMDRGNAVSLRLATVFGMSPRMRIDLLVNDFVYRALTDRAIVLFEPHFKRNYIHVRDVARAFLHAIANFGGMKDNAYNVGLSDANLSKWELCERIKRRLPGFVFIEAPIGEDPDKRDYIVSNAKIEATGFAPSFSLDAGIAELVKGFQMLRNTLYANV
jgi:nucleoside-diphosphate-sugar epimerase